MEPLSPGNQSNNRPHRLSAWLTDQFFWGFIILFGIGFVVSSHYTAAWGSNLIYAAGIIIACLIVLFLVRRQIKLSVIIPNPALEWWIMAAWYAVFMLASALTEGEGIFANEFGKWLWFIILPLTALLIIRGRSVDFKSLLQSVGFHRQGIGKAMLTGLLAYVVMIPVVIFNMPFSQLQKLENVFHSPVKALLMLPVAFLFSLITAACTEEIFFRGILQSRLAKVMQSEMRACLITAFLFGIYHLPYAWFSSSWPSHGNFTWAFSSVLVEQMLSGLILGILWLRTRNIASPILFHGLVNTIAIITMIKI